MADNNTIARPYAQAIFEVAESSGQLDDWSESLTTAGQLLGDRGLVEYLGNPEFNDAQRFEFLTGLFAEADEQAAALIDDGRQRLAAVLRAAQDL